MSTRSKEAEYSDVEGEDKNNNNNNAARKSIHPKSDFPKQGLPRKKTEISFGSILSGAIAFSCVFYMLYTTMLLVYFLSGNASGILYQKHTWTGLSMLELIFQDLWLLLLFVAQHTIMAKTYFKRIMSYLLPQHIHRCCYILCTGIAIQVLTSLWVNTLHITSMIIWDYSSSYYCSLVCQLLHLFSWVHTFAVVFMLDFSEFVGLKQVYYHVNNFGCPLHAKTPKAQRLFRHFRHATASGFLTIFWAVPCMTLDRLILASVFSVYLFSTNIDHEDEAYVQTMYKKKMDALQSR